MPRNKIHKLNGVFKNIPGKGQGESNVAKSNWYNRHLKYDFVCCQEMKTKQEKDCLQWFPISWHNNIYCSLNKDVDTAQGGVMIALNPHSDLKYVSHSEIEEGRVLLINDIEPGGGHTSEIFLQNTTCTL